MSSSSWRRMMAIMKREGGETVESIKTLVQFGCLLHVIHEYGIDVTTCIGPSMQPTFNPEEGQGSLPDVVCLSGCDWA